MDASTLTALHRQLTDRSIEVWLDGGWGVDALLCTQTREHDDVDLVVEHRDLEQVVTLLSTSGYRKVPRDYTRDWNFVMGDGEGNEVDLHVIVLVENGDGVYGPPENGDVYPAQALTGSGTISGRSVRCLSPEYQVHNHSGYDLRAKDYHDVSQLCRYFGLKPPPPYQV